MRLKSFIITIVALFVIANVIVAAMRRCGVIPDAMGADPGLQRAQPAQPASAEVGTSADEPPATPETAARPPVGIEGLHLQLSRPLMFDIGKLGGLAADDEHLYVAAWDEDAGLAMLYQVHPSAYTIVQVRALQEDGVTAIGGIDAGAGRIWVPLARGGGAPATVVLGISADTLEVRERFEVAAGFVALAAGDDGHVYGVTRDGALWAEWQADGAVVRQLAAAGGVRYTDLACVRGSLVAAGTDGVSGILDVIDPRRFTLLARHDSAAGGDAGAWPTSGGLEVRDDAVLLLPEGGAGPSLLTYVPEGGDLERFVPSVAGPRQ
jgi:hypothetical protein